MIHRRRLLKTAALGAGLAPFSLSLLVEARGRMKIVEIEEHEVVPPFHDYNAEALFRYHGLSMQTRVISTWSGRTWGWRATERAAAR